MAITVEDLLTKIRFRTKIPTGQISDALVLSTADDIIASKILPDLVSQNQNYLKYTDSFTATSSAYKYRFPKGAVGGGAVEILRKDVTEYYNMPNYLDSDKSLTSSTCTTPGFILTAGGFEVWPRPPSSFTVEVNYLLKPGKLVKASETAVITNVNQSLNTISLASTPTALLSSTQWDAMKTDGLCERTAVSLARGAGVAGTYLITGDISNVSIGDRVAVAGYSPFVQIPDEYIDYILDHLTMKMAQHTGDAELLKTAQNSAEDSKPKVANITSPRVKEEVVGVMIDW